MDGRFFLNHNKNNTIIKYWLYLISLLLFSLVIIGGATRMTGAGLSITEWKPIHGIIPPLNSHTWLEEFNHYKTIAQYRILNEGMTLEKFKYLFWWEWFHRFIARIIGLVVLIPLIFFWLKKWLQPWLKWRLFGILCLGFLQGAIGWWMVSSGLGNSQLTSVSPYRLAVHLTMAALILTAVFSLSQELVLRPSKQTSRDLQFIAGFVVFLILLQIYLGAIVAGLHAGLVDNTWPLVEGSFIPRHLFHLKPWWKSLFEDPRTTQFIHRLVAYVLFTVAIFQALYADKKHPKSSHAIRSTIFVVLVVIQATLGILTLLTFASVGFALIHQIGAFIVLLYAIGHWQAAKSKALTLVEEER